jgi:hypothetical protein
LLPRRDDPGPAAPHECIQLGGLVVNKEFSLDHDPIRHPAGSAWPADQDNGQCNPGCAEIYRQSFLSSELNC